MFVGRFKDSRTIKQMLFFGGVDCGEIDEIMIEGILVPGLFFAKFMLFFSGMNRATSGWELGAAIAGVGFVLAPELTNRIAQLVGVAPGWRPCSILLVGDQPYRFSQRAVQDSRAPENHYGPSAGIDVTGAAIWIQG